MPDLQSPPINKTHTWILVLLFWIIALLVFAVGYMLYGNKPEETKLTVAELVAECTASGFVDAATVPDATTGVCPEPMREIVTFEAPFSAVAFHYYQGWHIYTMADGGTGEEKMYVSIEPLSECTECSGPGLHAATIVVTERKLTQGESGVAQTNLAELKTNGTMTITRDETSSDAKMRVIGWTDNSICDGVGCSTGPHQTFYFEHSGHIVTASLQSADAEALAGWELFIASFDNTLYN